MAFQVVNVPGPRQELRKEDGGEPARRCSICHQENTNNRPYCWSCERQRVFTAYQVNRISFEFYSDGRFDAILYTGDNSQAACNAIDNKADELYRKGQEHYYLFVADQHMNEVSSISR